MTFLITHDLSVPSPEAEEQTQEEKDLFAKLTKLNSDIAKANADVTEAIRLATETESAAVKADISAEKGRQEARRLQVRRLWVKRDRVCLFVWFLNVLVNY